MLIGVTDHLFPVRPGQRNLSRAEWGVVTRELRTWYPECRLEIDVTDGEMGPFGVRLAGSVTVALLDGPDGRGAAASLLRRALDRVGRADLLELDSLHPA